VTPLWGLLRQLSARSPRALILAAALALLALVSTALVAGWPRSAAQARLSAVADGSLTPSGPAVGATPSAGSGAAATAEPTLQETSARSTQKPTATTRSTPATSWIVAPGGTEQVGSGQLYRYRVEVEPSTGLDAATVASFVDHVLADPRGWTNTPVAFQRVDSGTVQMVIRLATPATVDRLCAPLQTNGKVSCQNGSYVVLNLARWNEGVSAYAGDVNAYRTLVVNHEVGHRLGHSGHPPCPGPGLPQPVMMQVYYTGLQGCVRNVWPYAEDGTYIG
jgi:hypothetical protein